MTSPQTQNSDSPNKSIRNHSSANLPASHLQPSANLQTIRKLQQQLKNFRTQLPQRSMSSLLADELSLQGLGEATGTSHCQWLESDADHWNDVSQTSDDWDDINAIPLDPFDELDETEKESPTASDEKHDTEWEQYDSEPPDSEPSDSELSAEPLNGFHSSFHSGPVFSTSCLALDRWFPDQGIPAGSIIEIVSSAIGGGATHFCFALAKAICGDQGLLVIIDRRHDFHAAALVSLGFDLQNVLLVRPDNEEDHLWAMEQALAHPSVSAVWTRIETLDDRYQRRWQLAVEKSQAVGILQRPEKVLSSPTWAFAQLQVSPNPFSSLLTANQTYYQTNPRFQSLCKEGFPFSENWILDVQAVRIRGMFQQPLLRLELHNQAGIAPPAPASSISESEIKTTDLPCLSLRPIHPNDPAITKTFERFERNLHEVANDEPNVSATFQEPRFKNQPAKHWSSDSSNRRTVGSETTNCGSTTDRMRLDSRLADPKVNRRTNSA